MESVDLSFSGDDDDSDMTGSQPKKMQKIVELNVSSWFKSECPKFSQYKQRFVNA